MNAQTIDHFVALLRSHIWIPLLALFVFAIIRLSKSDAGVAWFPCRIKATSRPLWALGLGIVGGVLEQLFAGGTVLAAIVGPRMLTKFGRSKLGSPNSRLAHAPRLGCFNVPDGA